MLLPIFWIYNLAMKTDTSKRGRPRKTEDDRKSESLLLRLGSREKQGFADAARVAGIPLTVWIRERLRNASAKELKDANIPVAFLDPH